jgi:hypothetical protein
MERSAKVLSEFLHQYMLKNGVTGCPEHPNMMLGARLVFIFRKYGTGDVDDLCQAFALKLMSKDYLRGMPYSGARGYINNAALHHATMSVRARQRALRGQMKALPEKAPAVLDDELTPSEIAAFVDSLEDIHPKAPEYLELVIADEASDRGLILGGFFTDTPVSINYWTRYKMAIRAEFRKYEGM